MGSGLQGAAREENEAREEVIAPKPFNCAAADLIGGGFVFR
jgi:hypothetical protein